MERDGVSIFPPSSIPYCLSAEQCGQCGQCEQRKEHRCQNKLIWILHLRLLTPPTLPLSYTCPLSLIFSSKEHVSTSVTRLYLTK